MNITSVLFTVKAVDYQTTFSNVPVSILAGLPSAAYYVNYSITVAALNISANLTVGSY